MGFVKSIRQIILIGCALCAFGCQKQQNQTTKEEQNQTTKEEQNQTIKEEQTRRTKQEQSPVAIQEQKIQQQNENAYGVKTQKVQKGKFSQKLVFMGEILSSQNVQVFAKKPGKIESLKIQSFIKNGEKVTENTPIHEGDVFAVLEHKDVALQLTQFQAALKTAEASVAVNKLNYKDKQKDQERMKRLFSEGAITEKQQEMAILDFERAQVLLQQSQAQVEEVKARIAQANLALEEMFIKAPISGIVSKVSISEGNFASPSTPILSIISLDECKILLGVSEKLIPVLRECESLINIHVDTYPNQKFSSKVEKIYSTIDPATRMGTVEVLIKNIQTEKGHYMLLPGMFATAEIELKKNDEAITIPEESLLFSDKAAFVFVYDQGMARYKEVQVGGREAGLVEVLQGLKETDEVIVCGQHRLTDLAKVNRIEEVVVKAEEGISNDSKNNPSQKADSEKNQAKDPGSKEEIVHKTIEAK